MSEARGQQGLAVEWGAAGTALEAESGDLHVVAPFQGGVLLSVIDGLGHGPEAAAAAREAARILAAHAGEAVVALVQRCHEGLRNTRGAVLSLASFDSRNDSMVWTGVGNVEALLLRAGVAAERGREAITLRGGVVGYRLPPPRDAVLSVSRGDTLVMVTDGIRSGFEEGLAAPAQGGPQEIADAILAGYARGSDDALVLVARYLGSAP